jgi:hypothetical protein
MKVKKRLRPGKATSSKLLIRNMKIQSHVRSQVKKRQVKRDVRNARPQ